MEAAPCAAVLAIAQTTTFECEVISNQLERIASELGHGAVDELVAECDATIVRCLESARRQSEPQRSEERELRALATLLELSAPHERALLLREIRRVLRRLDTGAR